MLAGARFLAFATTLSGFVRRDRGPGLADSVGRRPLAMLAVTTIWFPRFLLSSGEGATVMLAGAVPYTLVVLMLLEWLVEPRLFRRKRYNPILLVLVAVAMVDWLGFFGLLIAPPVAAAVQILGSQFLAYRAISTTVAVDVSPRALAQQLATLRARMADAEGVSEETQAVVARLDALVEQARAARGSAVRPCQRARRLLDENRT